MNKEFSVFYKAKYSSWSRVADFDEEQDARNFAELLYKGNPDWAVKIVGNYFDDSAKSIVLYFLAKPRINGY